MNHKAHMIAGASTGTVISLFLLNYESTENALAGGFAVFLGSEFPDLDTGSIPSRVAARVGFLAGIVLIYFGFPLYAAIIGCIYMAVKAQPHRGITHSYLLPIICFVLARLVFPQYSVMITCFGIGLIVHNIIDHRNPANPRNWLPI